MRAMVGNPSRAMAKLAEMSVEALPHETRVTVSYISGVEEQEWMIGGR